MAKESNQKLKILYLLKFLHEESDDTHFVSMTQILDYLASCGIYAERKSVYSEICELEHFGFDIISRKGKKMQAMRLRRARLKPHSLSFCATR
ncbi:MAG: hypothetical protein L6V93_18865 [Clostridiales bacterium]|nr:MAG: hypothetical protein L6V93_18865 [Clostridiales bacterium]